MARISVEVVYATPVQQDLVCIELDEGTSALDALRASGLAQRHPEIASGEPLLGIFGARVKPGTPLRDHDRVEVYRRLLVDPKAVRRAKVSAKRRANRS
jgi:putative ubiquitin-RnfH superfamily antitoxin RatB of RatAB toxin-antitoxin module